MAGEREYAFVHALVRDVAYGQLPRVTGRRSTRRSPAGSRRRPAKATSLVELLAITPVTAFDLADGRRRRRRPDRVRGPAVRLPWPRSSAGVQAPHRVEAERLYLASAGTSPTPDDPRAPRCCSVSDMRRLNAGQFKTATPSLTRRPVLAADASVGLLRPGIRARIELNQALVYGEGRPHVELVDEALRIAEQLPPSADAGRGVDVVGLLASAGDRRGTCRRGLRGSTGLGPVRAARSAAQSGGLRCVQ